MDIAQLLGFGVQQGASDCHLSSGEPPMLRLNGEIKKLDHPALSKQEVHAMVYDMMSDSQRRAFEERELHYPLVGLAGADAAVVRPDRRSHPFHFFQNIGVDLFDERAHSRERLASPVAQLGDLVGDPPGRFRARDFGLTGSLHVFFRLFPGAVSPDKATRTDTGR